MKIFSFYFILSLLAITVQATLFKGTKPDFVFILVYFYSLRYGQTKGIAYGALTGLLIDLTSGFILGPNIISKMFIGYIVPSVKQRLFQWNIILNTALIAIFSIVDIFLIYIFIETFSGISFVNSSLKPSIIQVIYAVIIGLILYPVLGAEKYEINSI